MRQKKHKKTTRAVSFYRVNYGLHEPFKVLLDGNFIHATISANLSELDKHLPNLLGGRAKTFVTPCVMHELRSLGSEFKETAEFARRLKLHYCGHGKAGKPPSREQHNQSGGIKRPFENDERGPGEDRTVTEDQQQQPAGDGRLAAADCLLDQIGHQNAQHWWVATQDKFLRSKLDKVPGTPIIFATINGIHLETPSEMTKKTAKEIEDASMALPSHERKSEALKDLEAIRPKLRTSAKFRRNKAKGPNPLASKKKAKKTPISTQATHIKPGIVKQREGKEEGGNKRKRRRRKSGSIENPA